MHIHGAPGHPWQPPLSDLAPADNARRRAKVDAALDWQHANVRGGAAKLVYHTVRQPECGRTDQTTSTVHPRLRNTTSAVGVESPTNMFSALKAHAHVTQPESGHVCRC